MKRKVKKQYVTVCESCQDRRVGSRKRDRPQTRVMPTLAADGEREEDCRYRWLYTRINLGRFLLPLFFSEVGKEVTY